MSTNLKWKILYTKTQKSVCCTNRPKPIRMPRCGSTLVAIFSEKLVRFLFPGIRNNNNNPPFCKAPSKENGSGQYPVWMTKNPRKGDFRELKSKKYLRETCHWTPLPPPSPEACTFRSQCLARKPVSIHPSLIVPDDCAHTWIYMKNLHGLKILKFTLGSGLKALILCSLRSFIAAFMSSTCKKHY